MRYGIVVQYFPEKGFGFIRSDASSDVFFHATSLGACEEHPEIAVGQPVKYELDMSQKTMSQKKGARSEAREPTGGRRGPPRQRLRASLVELIDKIPGASLDNAADKQHPGRHKHARGKKPSWRR